MVAPESGASIAWGFCETGDALGGRPQEKNYTETKGENLWLMFNTKNQFTVHYEKSSPGRGEEDFL